MRGAPIRSGTGTSITSSACTARPRRWEIGRRDFDQIKDGGRGIAGSPATVVRMIKSQMEEAGTDYFVAQFAFGDLTLSEVLRTVELFAREVMPALRDA